MEMEMERNDESVAAFGRGGNPSSMDAGVGVAKKKSMGGGGGGGEAGVVVGHPGGAPEHAGWTRAGVRSMVAA